MFRTIIRSKKFIFGLCIVSFFIIISIFANFIAPYGYEEQNVGPKLLEPNSEYIFGTDNHGRDMFSRVIYGSRISLFVSILTGLITGSIGTVLGILSGFYKDRASDYIIMRFMDIIFSIPWILVALMLAIILNPGITTVILSLSIVYIPQMTRVVRSATFGIIKKEYMLAARINGDNNLSLMFKYIFPNIFNVVIVQVMFIISFSIIGEAALSFLGYGIRQPVPSWGLLLQNAQKFMWSQSYLIIVPGIAIVLGVLGLNFLGDGLRDILDPKYQRIYKW